LLINVRRESSTEHKQDEAEPSVSLKLHKWEPQGVIKTSLKLPALTYYINEEENEVPRG
jgi:hypothetical protein